VRNLVRRSRDALDLEAVFNPKSIAVIGASTTFGKWGQFILSNVIAGGYAGKIFPVNPKQREMFGLKVYERVTDIPDPVDLAFITIPAKTVPGVLEACGDKGVKGVVLITSGFSETDEAGKVLERHVVDICLKRKLTTPWGSSARMPASLQQAYTRDRERGRWPLSPSREIWETS
jgi:acyl-CoA synthetase (NDP forming)